MDCTFPTPQGTFNYRVAAIIVCKGELLAMREEHLPHWYLPGGRVRLQESAQQALLRELREELSLPGKILRPLWLNQAFYPLDGVGQVHELCLYFLVEIPLDGLPTGEEFSLKDSDGVTHLYRWFSGEDLQGLPLYPSFLQEEWPRLPDSLQLREERE